MRIDIASIFPEMFGGPLGCSIVARAQENRLVAIHVHDLRDHTADRHRSVDDYPYGGGAGMVMRPEPFFRLFDSLAGRPSRVVMFTPAGRRLDQGYVRCLAQEPWLLLLCGHYEGVDERVSTAMGADEVSLGDYVLTGGELPAMVLVDAIVRQLPGVLGAPGSLYEESFTDGLLEYPQYTRPPEIRGLRVPNVLMSGDHRAIAAWRRRAAIERTALRRPDLLATAALTPAERAQHRTNGAGAAPSKTQDARSNQRDAPSGQR
jgi:tRNA (guanine37-N1)-methyltransferase